MYFYVRRVSADILSPFGRWGWGSTVALAHPCSRHGWKKVDSGRRGEKCTCQRGGAKTTNIPFAKSLVQIFITTLRLKCVCICVCQSKCTWHLTTSENTGHVSRPRRNVLYPLLFLPAAASSDLRCLRSSAQFILYDMKCSEMESGDVAV